MLPNVKQTNLRLWTRKMPTYCESKWWILPIIQAWKTASNKAWEKFNKTLSAAPNHLWRLSSVWVVILQQVVRNPWSVLNEMPSFKRKLRTFTKLYKTEKQPWTCIQSETKILVKRRKKRRQGLSVWRIRLKDKTMCVARQRNKIKSIGTKLLRTRIIKPFKRWTNTIRRRRKSQA